MYVDVDIFFFSVCYVLKNSEITIKLISHKKYAVAFIIYPYNLMGEITMT